MISAALPHIFHTLKVVRTSVYDKACAGLLDQAQRRAMEDEIAANPFVAPVIPGAGGIRKKRWALPEKGKSGGIRTIYYYHGDDDSVYLLTAYAKSKQEDLTPQDKKAWTRFVKAIKQAARGG